MNESFLPADFRVQRHLSLLDAGGHAVIATDGLGRITFWNEGARTLYGWTAGEVMGKNIVDVTPAELSRDEARSIMDAIARGEVWSGQFEVRGRTAEPFRVAVTDLPLLDSLRHIVGVVGISSPQTGPASIRDVLGKAAAAVERIWPGQVSLEIDDLDSEVRSVSSEPHLLQLILLLIVSHLAAIDEGRVVEMSARRAADRDCDLFGLNRSSQHDLALIQVGLRSGLDDSNAAREVLRVNRESRYLAPLVNIAEGQLMAGSSPGHPITYHFFLPIMTPPRSD